MPRLSKQPIINQEELNIRKDFIRFATPKEVAVYRAERLKCERILEIGAGIGGQTIAFSKKCRKVLAVEMDKRKAESLNQNLKKLNIKNVEVLSGDIFSKSISRKIKEFKPQIIFCDTERPEKAERTLDKIQPPIEKILETFSNITFKIAIEIPPFTKNLEELKDYPFEKEFISLNKQLNRLTIYFNELKSAEISVVALPSKERLIKKEISIPQEISSLKGASYLSIIDPAVQIAELIPEIAEKTESEILYLNKPVLISSEIPKSNFLTNYQIIAICKNEQETIVKELKKAKAGKVVLRYNVDPKEYWKVRNAYELKLNKSNNEATLFIDEKRNEAIICERIQQ